MKSVLQFLRGCVQHPKTSAAGVASIATGIALLVHDPASILRGEPVLAILLGVGLLLSADAKPEAQ